MQVDDLEELCEGQSDLEYFRLKINSDCRDVVRCDKAGFGGCTRFDLDLGSICLYPF